MRNQRAGQATFIPLDTIQVKPINDKFRAFAKGARLAVDVIQYEPVMERAIHHACGNALVCDTMEVARYICYEKGQEVKGTRSVCRCIACKKALTRRLWGSGDARWHDHPQKRINHWGTQHSRQREEVGGERYPGYVLLPPMIGVY
jgi:chromosome segregation ATPase